DSGQVILGTNLEVAYIDQARADLKDDMLLKDALAPLGGDQIMVRGAPKHVAAYAKEFLFTDAQIRQPVRSLSGGERNRLLLARALAQPANLMVLDEPTNDLDMETLDLLEAMLSDYEGTLILVSHDRDFVDRLATSTIGLNGHGQVVETPGGWLDFLSQNPGFFGVSPAKAPGGRRAYKEQRRLEELNSLIAEMPGKIALLEGQLADPELYSRDPAAFDRYGKALAAAREKLEAAEMEWLELEERREALEAGR
ncbi:MAG: elongation factor 3, partial [Caulobacterales bacterium 32-67-6]